MDKKIAASLFAGIITFSCFTYNVNCTIVESADVSSEQSVRENTTTQLSDEKKPAVTEITSQNENRSEVSAPITLITDDIINTENTTVDERSVFTETELTDEKQPEIEIIAPTSFILSLDPFMINHSDSQISSDNFYIINNSSSPVTVTVSMKLDCSEDVDITDTKNFIASSESDKKMWLGAVKSVSHSNSQENGSLVFDYGDITSYNETNTEFFNQEKELSFTFTLSEKGSDSSISGFRFIGTLSEIMDWNKEDVHLNMSYSVNP